MARTRSRNAHVMRHPKVTRYLQGPLRNQMVSMRMEALVKQLKLTELENVARLHLRESVERVRHLLKGL